MNMHYFEYRTGRAVSRREAFEADGKTLRDGISIRVRMSAKDSVPRGADGRSFWDAHRAELLIVDPRRVGGVEGNRPGFRVSDSPINRQAVLDAYQQYEAELTSAYRNLPRDAAFGSLDAKKKEDPPVTGRSRCAECDGRGVVHGKTCQGCGGDGWVDDDENGDDEDDGETTADARIASIDALSVTHQQNMSRIYDQIAVDLSQEWRRGK
jgi:hypothetical protein